MSDFTKEINYRHYHALIKQYHALIKQLGYINEVALKEDDQEALVLSLQQISSIVTDWLDELEESADSDTQWEIQFFHDDGDWQPSIQYDCKFKTKEEAEEFVREQFSSRGGLPMYYRVGEVGKCE